MSGRSSVPAFRGASARYRRRRRCRRYRQGSPMPQLSASAATRGSSAAMTWRPSVWPSGTSRTATETCAVHRGGEEAEQRLVEADAVAAGDGADGDGVGAGLRAGVRRRPTARLRAAMAKASPVSVVSPCRSLAGGEGEAEIGELRKRLRHRRRRDAHARGGSRRSQAAMGERCRRSSPAACGIGHAPIGNRRLESRPTRRRRRPGRPATARSAGAAARLVSVISVRRVIGALHRARTAR